MALNTEQKQMFKSFFKEGVKLVLVFLASLLGVSL